MFIRKPKNSIREFFLTLSMLSVMLPLVLLGGTALIISVNALKDQVAEANMQQLKTISTSIEHYLIDPVEELSSIKTLLEKGLEPGGNALNLVLLSITDSHDFIISTQVANQDGIIQAVYPYNKSLISTDVSGHEYFHETKTSQKAYWAPTFMSDQIDTPVSAFSLPWEHGVITAFVSLKEIANLSRGSDTGKYQKEILVTDQQGVFIAHPDEQKVLLREYDPRFRHCKEKWAGQPFTDLINYQGQEYLSQVIFIPDTGWKVAVNQSSAALYASVKKMALWLITLTLSILVLAIFLGHKLSAGITGPLTDLVGSTNIISSGNYQLKLPAMKFSELSQLSESFQRMADNVSLREGELKAHRSNLEAMVQSRTEELSKTNKALEEEKERVEAANRAKSVFLTNMSHELRTPLNAVLGYSEILASRELDYRNKRYLEAIKSSGKALLSLINDVLDLAKIEAGKQTLEKKSVSIPELFKEIDTIFRGKTSEKDIELLIETADNLPDHLMLDEVKLRQVLINLVGNAVKFTDSGQIYLGCRTAEKRDENVARFDLIIEVKDTGKGISLEDREVIFGVFDQATGQKTSDFGGTGLGLAICRSMVDLMGGTIKLTSQEGEGSLFSIYLPDVETASLDMAGDTKADMVCPDYITFDFATILIAEDIDYNRDMLAAFLEKCNFKIHFAVNGKEAVEKAIKIRPDIVLMDWKMPVMDGFEASKIIKNSKETADIPIIIVSASARHEDEEKMHAFAEGYLTKPVSQLALFNEMKNFLKHSLSYPEPTEQLESAEIVAPDQKTLATLSELALDGDLEGVRDILIGISADINLQLFSNIALGFADNYDDIGLMQFINEYNNEKPV